MAGPFSLLADDNASLLADDNAPSVEFLLKNKVHRGTDSFQCLVCFKFIKHKSTIKVHMRDMHCDTNNSKYYCASCERWFRNRKSVYHHVRKNHKDGNAIDYEQFRITHS